MHFTSSSPVSNVSFFLGYARHFPTSVALTAPGRNRLCLLQGLLGRGSRRFFQWIIVIAFCIRKAYQAKGQGQNHGQQDRGDLFHRKALPLFRYVGFCSRRVLSRFIVPYCFIFSTIILFFVLVYIFSVLHQRAVCCVFCPTGAGSPTLHPGLSNFYQNVGFLPSRLIFHSLHPCRAS